MRKTLSENVQGLGPVWIRPATEWPKRGPLVQVCRHPRVPFLTDSAENVISIHHRPTKLAIGASGGSSAAAVPGAPWLQLHCGAPTHGSVTASEQAASVWSLGSCESILRSSHFPARKTTSPERSVFGRSEPARRPEWGGAHDGSPQAVPRPEGLRWRMVGGAGLPSRRPRAQNLEGIRTNSGQFGLKRGSQA